MVTNLCKKLYGKCTCCDFLWYCEWLAKMQLCHDAHFNWSSLYVTSSNTTRLIEILPFSLLNVWLIKKVQLKTITISLSNKSAHKNKFAEGFLFRIPSFFVPIFCFMLRRSTFWVFVPPDETSPKRRNVTITFFFEIGFVLPTMSLKMRLTLSNFDFAWSRQSVIKIPCFCFFKPMTRFLV